MTDALGYANGRKAVSDHVDEDQKAAVTIRDASQRREFTTITEGGLYALVMGSKLPQARMFKRGAPLGAAGAAVPDVPNGTSTFNFNALIDGVSRTFPIRVVTLDGAPWFVASDCCKVLGIAQPTFAYRRLGDDEQRMVARSTLGLAKGAQMYVISESGLYKLIMRSDKPQARPVAARRGCSRIERREARLVTREVLPSTRKTGSYELPKGEVMPLPADIASGGQDDGQPIHQANESNHANRFQTFIGRRQAFSRIKERFVHGPFGQCSGEPSTYRESSDGLLQRQLHRDRRNW